MWEVPVTANKKINENEGASNASKDKWRSRSNVELDGNWLQPILERAAGQEGPKYLSVLLNIMLRFANCQEEIHLFLRLLANGTGHEV